MRLDYRVIPHRAQRYPTAGDYFRRKGVWCFRVSRMKDKRYAVLVLLHEIIEFFLCRLAGVKMGEIDRFDIKYEESRAGGWSDSPCGCKHVDEPGDDPHSPYHVEHQTATKCEKIIAKAIGVNWREYNEAVESL